MGNRDAQQFLRRNLVGEWRISRDGLYKDVFAPKLERPVPDQRPGKQTSFAKNLKPVANPKHRSPISRELLDGLHYRAESSNRPGAQVIPIAEAARDNHSI